MQKENLKESYKCINVLDALSASGLRSIRFVKEIDPTLMGKVYANDLSTASISLIKENADANEISSE